MGYFSCAFKLPFSRMSGVTVKDCDPAQFINALAEHFKGSGKIELPEWHDLVKTATFKEMCPMDPDWYYVRAASVARKLYLRGGVGVGAFTKVYGGSSHKSVETPHFKKAARGVIRHVLHQLQELDIVGKKKDKKGRWITRNGQRELDTIAGQLNGNVDEDSDEDSDDEDDDDSD